MKAYHEMLPEELKTELAQLKEQHRTFVQKGLKLNMARGKPSPEQLDLSMPMLDLLPSAYAGKELQAGEDDDLRNYGGLTGLAEMRELMGALMRVPADNVIIGGNSSLNMMFDMVNRAMTHGVLGSTPWAKLEGQPIFLCPAPGYDRHFSICEHFGIKMIPVPLFETGPDMDLVEQMVGADPLVKGIWCVPRFSNPTGCVYSDETVRRLASLAPAAEDFRLFWDNAYAVHDLANGLGDAQGEAQGEAQGKAAAMLLDIKEASESASNPNIWYQFVSTSKITFAGNGVAAMASSKENIKSIAEAIRYQTIGPDKINQKRHLLFLPDLQAVQAHMAKHAAILGPKFDTVERVLAEGLAEAGVGTWTHPQGGYFISFDGAPRTARRTIELAAEAGVTLTPAGATYPYGEDFADTNIRIAPSYPELEELEIAVEVFVVCARLAALEQLISE